MGVGLAECNIVEKTEIQRKYWGVFVASSEQIFELRQEGYTLEQIGQKIGCSKEWVRQIIIKHYGRIEPKLLPESEVARRIGCSASMLTTLREKGAINPKRRSFYWLYDANELNKAKLAVEANRQQHKPLILKCEQCGKEFELGRSKYNARLRQRKIPSFFCSRHCYGKYLGLHYGFLAHPEHIIEGGAKKKWNSSKVYALWEETKWPLWQLGKVLGIPSPTIGSILQQYPAYVNRPHQIPRRPILKKLPITLTTARLRKQLDEAIPESGLSPELKLYSAILGERHRDDKGVLVDVYIHLHEPESGEYKKKCVDWVNAILKEARAADTEAIREPIHNLLDQLTERERRVLWLRFGLEDGRSRTLEEVGKEFHVTRERIRQIEAKALRKLRHPSKSRQLRDYLDQNDYQIGQHLREKVFEEYGELNPLGLFVLWQEDRWALKREADKQIYAAEEETREMRAKIPQLESQVQQLTRWASGLKFPSGRLYPQPITEFGVSARAVNPLRRAKQWLSDTPTVGEVAVLTDDELLNIPSFGQKCLLEIKEALVAAGASEWQWQLFTSRFSEIILVKLHSEKEV